MAWNIMTWNTQLYEQGNSFSNGQEKPINSACYEKIFDTIAEYLESKNNSIAVLQEIPYCTNRFRAWPWPEHEIFTAFKKKFPKVDYDVFYNVIPSGQQLKMTVVIAKKGIIERDDEIDIGDNCFVGFKIEKTDLRVLAIHSHDASDLVKWLAKNEGYSPQIILGDFNAGNYKKKNEDHEFVENKKNYLMICKGYIDLFQGCYTTSYKTHIDHVLIEKSNEFHGKYSSKNIDVDYGMTLSDHYPLSFLLELQKNPNLPA